jgi:hypothetical protein
MGFQGRDERSAQLVERAAKERRGEAAVGLLRKVLAEFPQATVAVDERTLTLTNDGVVMARVHVTREECELLRNLNV